MDTITFAARRGPYVTCDKTFLVRTGVRILKDRLQSPDQVHEIKSDGVDFFSAPYKTHRKILRIPADGRDDYHSTLLGTTADRGAETDDQIREISRRRPSGKIRTETRAMFVLEAPTHGGGELPDRSLFVWEYNAVAS